MRHILGVLFSIITVTVGARGVDFDASMLSQCLALANDPTNTTLREKFEAHPNNLLMKSGLPDRYQVSYEQISQQRERLQNYADMLPSLKANLEKLTTEATEFLGPNAMPEDFSIRIVCGARYDGFGFSKDGQQYLFMNLPVISADFFPHLLRHELWHVAYRNQNESTAKAYERSENALKNLSYIMLNEGVGHYYSLRRRLEPKIVYDNWQERTNTLFTKFHEQMTKLANAKDDETKEELLWTSSAGGRFWDKWGAVTGAVITYRIKQKLGIPTLQSLIAAGPCAFLTRYHEEAEKTADWENIPDGLVKATCAVSN